MTYTHPGDIVFSFCDTYIKAVGVVTGTASTSPRPSQFGATGAYWGDEGWYVPVDFRELRYPIRPRDHMSILAPLLPTTYSPLQKNGNGLQGVYLAELPDPLALTIVNLLNGQVEKLVAGLGETARVEYLDDASEETIRGEKDITETEKEQLIKARMGQGLFRSRVELIESCCRVTGVTAREHLRASHIKPWRVSNNSEKLDGNNGLLLSPHIDHLFDRGYISFLDDGRILISPLLDASILLAWNIDKMRSVGHFKSAQKTYLSYHRDYVFKTR
jgi:hypothetical protein